MISGSQAEDLYWATFRFVNPRSKTVYHPTFKLLLGERDLTNTVQSEYSFSRGVKFVAKLQAMGITEQEQVLMRAICCLASGKLSLFLGSYIVWIIKIV